MCMYGVHEIGTGISPLIPSRDVSHPCDGSCGVLVGGCPRRPQLHTTHSARHPEKEVRFTLRPTAHTHTMHSHNAHTVTQCTHTMRTLSHNAHTVTQCTHTMHSYELKDKTPPEELVAHVRRIATAMVCAFTSSRSTWQL